MKDKDTKDKSLEKDLEGYYDDPPEITGIKPPCKPPASPIGAVFQPKIPGEPAAAYNVGVPFFGIRIGRIDVVYDLMCDRGIKCVHLYGEGKELLATIFETPFILIYKKEELPASQLIQTPTTPPKSETPLVH